MAHRFYTRWLIGGIVVLLIVAGACVLWYQHDTAPYKRKAAETEAFAREWEKNQKAKRESSTETETASPQAPAESNTQSAEKSITNVTQNSETTNIETNTNNGVIAETTKPVRMSPHGFGPYPEIPEGAPIGPFSETQNVNQELIGRVLVKLWNEGDRHTGGGVYDAEQGKVYPYYPNVIYVKYENELNFITGQYETKITEATSSYENADVVEAVVRGDVPPGYKLIDVEESGFNPYQYLDLPNK